MKESGNMMKKPAGARRAGLDLTAIELVSDSDRLSGL